MPKYHSKNERMKREYFHYLVEAEGKSASTLEAVGKSLLRYEKYTGFKDFATFHRERVIALMMRLLSLLFPIVMLLALPSCASDLRNFQFEFGMLDPNKDVEILNWRYGNSTLPYSHAPTAYLATGHIPQADNVHGMFPPGDVLYVKWRVLSTGKVYEDTVDLHSSLPWDMNGKTIHFAVKGPQLYVYLIEGITSKQLHSHAAPDCPLTVYAPFQCSRIYPDHWSNF